MDIHDITTTMRQRNITIRKMARALHMNESVLGGILGGKRVLTERTRTLIELYLEAHQTLDAADIRKQMKQRGMDIHEIKSEMARRKITVRAMANDLAMNERSLGMALNGKRPLSESLRRHIELYLAAPQTLDAADIKQRMKQRGMSIAALAAELGITPDTLGRVLNGKQPMRTELQRHIALLLERGNDAPQRRRVMVLFEVEMPSSSVRMMIGADEAAMDVEEKRRCLESVIRGAMGELAKMGQDFEPVSR